MIGPCELVIIPWICAHVSDHQQAGNGQRKLLISSHRLPAPHLNGEQILFLIGLTIIIGLQKTLIFFARRQKLKGTAAFIAGIALILLKWAFVGFVVELYGIFVLFGDFLSTIAGFANNIPMIGPYIARALSMISSGPRNKELPV